MLVPPWFDKLTTSGTSHLLSAEPGQRRQYLLIPAKLDDAVAEEGGFFELEVLGGFAHLGFQVFNQAEDFLPGYVRGIQTKEPVTTT
jgi:hypothetical protein